MNNQNQPLLLLDNDGTLTNFKNEFREIKNLINWDRFETQRITSESSVYFYKP